MARWNKKGQRKGMLNFKKKKYGFKKTYGKKKGFKGQFKKKKFRKSSHKQMVLNNLLKSVPSHAFVQNYVDAFSVVGTTNQRALQGVWGTQQSSGALSSAQQPRPNLQLTPNGVMQQILGQYTSASRGPFTTTGQILLRDCVQKVRLTNLSTGPVILTEYRCRARKDFSLTGVASLAAVLSGGFADAASPGTAGDAVYQAPLTTTTYGATLFMNPRFVAMAKIMKVRKRELRPSGVLKLSYAVRKARVIKNEDFNYGTLPDADGSTGVVRDISVGQSFSVFIVQGTIASATAAETGGAINNLGIGNVSIGMVYETTIHYSIIDPAGMVSAASSGIPGYSAGIGAFPAPIVQNQPLSVVAPATGVRTYAAAANDTFVIRDTSMVDT